MENPNPKKSISMSDLSVAEQPSKEMPLLVKIKPGSSSEKSVKLILPKEMAKASIDEVIEYVLKNPDIKRKDARIAERVEAEMKSAYGITVNNTSVKGSEKLTDYFVARKSSSGMDYKEAEIIIASEQQGGLGYRI